MITLKGSRFKVEYDENATATNGYRVFVRKCGKYEEVTTTLTDDDKNTLIADLIYCVTDLVKERDLLKEHVELYNEIEKENYNIEI